MSDMGTIRACLAIELPDGSVLSSQNLVDLGQVNAYREGPIAFIEVNINMLVKDVVRELMGTSKARRIFAPRVRNV